MMSSSHRDRAGEQGQGRATLACLNCKSGKRQCDKRLPICSRCKKLDRPCEYRTAPPPDALTEQFELGPFMDMVWPNACTRCKLHKRRCDRMVPKCSRCLRLGSSCTFQAPSMESPRVAPANTDAATNVVQPRIECPLLAQPEVGVAFEPPIRYRSYMPHLIKFFLTSIALPSDTVVAYSLAHHLRSQWIQHAMSDPCLFHATLFSASASIDMLRGQKPIARTLYHQTWALRLINEQLAQTEPVLNYGTLATVIPLLYYNMVALDRDSAAAHQKGLVKMLLATPHSLRANIGPLIAIVKVAMISFACIYDVLPLWDCLSPESVRPNTILRNIVSRATFGKGDIFFEKETIEAILDVYETISRLDHLVHAEHYSIYAEVERALPFARMSNGAETVEGNQRLSPLKRLNLCCRICCKVFWKIIRRPSLLHVTEDHDLQQLLKQLSQIEPLYWIRNAPEVFTWAAFTGAAAAKDQDARVNFISMAGTILTAIEDEELTLIRQGWSFLRLLKSLGGDDNQLASFGDSGYGPTVNEKYA